MAKEKRRYFLTGFLVVLPVLITVYLFISLFLFFDNILGRYVNQLAIAYFGYKIPGLGLLVFVVLIFTVGFFATNFIGRKVLLYFEKLWLRFPIIKKIYPAAKQVTRFFFGQGVEGQLQKVVLVQWPSRGIWNIGFLTNPRPHEEIRDNIGERDVVCVLIPTVPNPLTGFLAFFPRSDVKFLNMTVEEAVKIVVSGGVLDPRALTQGDAALLED